MPSAHGRFSTLVSTLGVSQRRQAPRCMAQTNRVGRPSTGTNWKWRVSKRSQPDPRQPEEEQADFQVAVAALGAARAAVAINEGGQLVDAIQDGAQFHGGTSSGPAERAYGPVLLQADGCRQARHGVRAILERAPPRSAVCGRSLASRSRVLPREIPEESPRHGAPDVAAGAAK